MPYQYLKWHVCTDASPTTTRVVFSQRASPKNPALSTILLDRIPSYCNFNLRAAWTDVLSLTMWIPVEKMFVGLTTCFCCSIWVSSWAARTLCWATKTVAGSWDCSWINKWDLRFYEAANGERGAFCFFPHSLKKDEKQIFFILATLSAFSTVHVRYILYNNDHSVLLELFFATWMMQVTQTKIKALQGTQFQVRCKALTFIKCKVRCFSFSNGVLPSTEV